MQVLREQPEIKPDRVGILGHSEGGLLALAADELLRSDGVPPTVLVLVSTPGRTMDAVIHDQLVRLLAKQKANERETKFYLDENARIAKAVLETGRVPDDVPAGLKALYPAYLGKFLKSNFSVEPCNLAARFLGPVLVIAGEKDIQVSPELDAGALDAALKTRPNDDHLLIIVASASHNLKAVKDDREPGFAGDVAPDIVDRLGQWVAAKLAD